MPKQERIELEEVIERMDNGTKFNDAWSSIGLKYPYLCMYFGGLVPTFLERLRLRRVFQ